MFWWQWRASIEMGEPIRINAQEGKQRQVPPEYLIWRSLAHTCARRRLSPAMGQHKCAVR